MNKKKIMIIEDDLELLGILHDHFVSEGFDVTVYPDKNSVKRVIINRPHIILLDDRLKDGLGHELCTRIKGNDLTNGIPVILTSGHPHLRELKDQCGADDYMEKPFDLDLLAGMVRRHLQANN
jgi:DNA-binding response OmpR family regulator